MRHPWRFFLVLLFLSIGTVRAHAAPDITVSRSWDSVAIPQDGAVAFDPVAAGVPDSRRFQIGNAGNASLLISNATSLVSGSCFSLIETPDTPVLPGGNAYFRVRIQCATPGNYSGTVTIASNDPDTPQFRFSVSGTVTGAAPDLAVFRDWDGASVANGGTFAFDPVQSGVPDSRRFRIANNGTANLSISNAASLVSGNCFSQIETPETPVLPGASAYFRVRIQCAAAGTYSGSVTIATNDPDTPQHHFTITGTVLAAPAPDIALFREWDGAPVSAGSTFAFDPIAIGALDSRRFRIDNAGGSSLVLSNAASLVSGTCFSQIETPVTPIPPGGSGYLRVRFQCGTAGAYSGTVSIASNDPDESPYVFSVSASAVPATAPDIAVYRNWDNVAVPTGGTFTFPDPVPAGQADSRLFRIENRGTDALTIANPSTIVSGNCYSQLDVLPSTIAAGSSATVRVRLSCATGGTYNGLVSILSNDPDESPYTIALSGTVAAPLTNNAAYVSQSIPATMNAGAAYDVTVTMRNNGTTTWTAAASHRLGIRPDAAAATWSISRVNLASGESIAPGASKTFAVHLIAPPAPGAYAFQWRMVQENLEWFGDTTPLTTINVVAPPARDAVFVRQSVPTQMIAARRSAVSVTMRNSGSTPWSAAGGTRLASLVPNNPWGGPFAIPAGVTVAAGAEYTFSFNVTPQAAGTVDFRWQMMEGSTPFGAATPNVSVSVRYIAPPVIDAITPEHVLAGTATNITITGRNFSGALVSIPPRSNGQPTPIGSLVSINAAGTQIVLRVDATDPETEGFHGIFVENVDGRDGIDFRVVPAHPVIDAYTPSQASWGDLYYVALAGVNLDGATVTSMNPAVQFLDMQSSDEMITGVLSVAPGAGSTSTELEIRGPGGATRVPIELRARTALAKSTTLAGAAKGETDGGVFVQEATQVTHGDKDGKGGTLPKGLEIDCNFSHSRGHSRSGTIVLLRNPLTHQAENIFNGMRQGETRPFELLIARHFGSVTASVTLTCHLDENGNFDVDIDFCLSFVFGFEVIGVGGQIVEGTACIGGSSSVELSGSGFVNFNYRWGDGDDAPQCSTIRDTSPDPFHGLRQGEVTLDTCCQEPVSIDTEFTLSPEMGGGNDGLTRRLPDITPADNCPGGSCYFVYVRAFIPDNNVRAPWEACLQDLKWIYYRGDDRLFTAWPGYEHSRVEQSFCAQTGQVTAHCGETLKVTSDGIVNGRISAEALADTNYGDCDLAVYRGHGDPGASLTRINGTPAGVYKWRSKARSSIPGLDVAVFAAIDWNLEITVDTRVSPPQVTVSGIHDGFPGYEVWINGKQIYGWDPAGSFPIQLLGSGDTSVDCTITLGNAPCLRN